MEKVNIKPFLSGDRVYYVGPSNDLPKNTILIVDDCFIKPCKCNEWVVSIKGYQNIGTIHPIHKGDIIRCYHCGSIYKALTSNRTKFAKRFRPAQELNVPSMTFTKVAEVEKEEVLILN